MYIQLLYKQQLGVYYKLISALVLTQFLHTQLHCDSENQTRLHFQMPPTILLLRHKLWNSSWLKVWSGLQQTIVDEARQTVTHSPVSEW